MLETLSRLLVYGIFKQLLSSGNVIGEDTTGEDELSKVFTEDFKVEWNLLLSGVSGIKRRV